MNIDSYNKIVIAAINTVSLATTVVIMGWFGKAIYNSVIVDQNSQKTETEK